MGDQLRFVDDNDDTRFAGSLYDDGATVGDVLTVQSDGSLAAAAGGGSGSAVVRAFPFQFDTPNLHTGAALYTPTVGDVLLDLWVTILTAWDGTGTTYTPPQIPGASPVTVGPLGDVGNFIGSEWGLFANITGWATLSPSSFTCLDMSAADGSFATFGATPGLFGASGSPGGNGSLRQSANVGDVQDNLVVASGSWVAGDHIQLSIDDTFPVMGKLVRATPAVFVTADPIKMVVSQDGSNTGGDPVATQGSAVLYLVTATPQ